VKGGKSGLIRQRSEEEEDYREYKKGRTQSKEALEGEAPIGNSEEVNSDEMGTENSSSTENKSEMAKALIEALNDDDAAKLLVKKFNEVCRIIIGEETKELKAEVKEIGNRTTGCEEEINELKRRVDETEQFNRGRNLILSGKGTKDLEI
jgi:hypothetical protein